MTGKAQFSDEDWKTVLEGPTSAGLVVAAASRGGSFKESFSMAKAYTEARKRHGESELLDEVVSSRPKMDHTVTHSPEEMRQHNLENLRSALGVLEGTASAAEIEEYKRFIIGLSERVAEAHKGVSSEERTAVEEIADALGVEAPEPPATG